jgi:KDO2-lipid IV(A) lauroyltransferase
LDWLVYFVVRILICLVQALPIDRCHGLARRLAVLMADVLHLRERVVEENLRQAYPQWTSHERRAVTRRMWEHLFLMVCEVAHAPRKIHETNWRDFVTFVGARQLASALLDPRPVVLVSGHFGNFEMVGYISGLLGYATYSIARPLDNLYLQRFLGEFRGATGQFMLPKKGSAKQVQAVLDTGQTLALLGDQHAGRKGCWVDFFGKPTSCHKAVALLSLGSRAPLIVGYVRRLGRPMNFEMVVTGVADPADSRGMSLGVSELTQWYNLHLEQIIRIAPEQYWWLHRRWKQPPPRQVRAPQPRHVPHLRCGDPSRPVRNVKSRIDT